MAEIEGQGRLSSTKQTACILMVCTHYSEDFCPNVTEIRPVSPNSNMMIKCQISNSKLYSTIGEQFWKGQLSFQMLMYIESLNCDDNANAMYYSIDARQCTPCVTGR